MTHCINMTQVSVFVAQFLVCGCKAIAKFHFIILEALNDGCLGDMLKTDLTGDHSVSYDKHEDVLIMFSGCIYIILKAKMNCVKSWYQIWGQRYKLLLIFDKYSRNYLFFFFFYLM